LVVQQEAAVVNIEMKGEEVVQHMDEGVGQLNTAIDSARSRNRKKWYCLGICVLIVAVIVIAIAITQPWKHNNQTTKRSIPTIVSTAVIPGTDFATSDRLVVPGLEWKSSKMVVPGVGFNGDKAVVPGADFTPVVRKWKKFVA